MAKNNEMSVESVVETGRTVMEKTFNTQKEQAQKATDSAKKSLEDATKMQSEAINALLESQMIFTKGMEEITKNFMNYAQKAMVENAEIWKAVSEIKSPEDFAKLGKTNYQVKVDELLQNGAQIGEKLANIASESNRHLQKFWQSSTEKLVK